MDEFATLATQLGAALRGSDTEADRLLLLQAVGHALALTAALLVPLGVFYFASRRRDIEFRSLLWAFAAAGAAVALSQGLALWNLWQPDQWLQGAIQTAAAGLAFAVTIALWLQLPHAVHLPSTRQLRRANANLTRETWEQQRALEEAQNDAALLRGLVDATTFGTALLSPAGRWLLVNDALAVALALPRTELLKREPRQLFGDGLLDGDAIEEERECAVRDERRWYRWNASLISGVNGRGRGRLIQCRDITAEKHAENELARLRQTLQKQTEEWAREAGESAARLEQALAEKQTSEIELAARAARLERSAAQLEHLGARLSEMAGSDPDTGLLSSHALAGRLDLAVSLARRYGKAFSVLVVSPDPVEDANGDALRMALGSVLRAELRETDAAASCDEERICVLLPETDTATAARVAERIRRRLAATPLAAADGRTLRLTCCIGAAQWKAGQGLGEVLGQAADALRSARADGRNRSAASGEERGART
jgi:diguanylate cyclase (GGDEF)-like protein/PAS domain S-box-containing protein